MSVAAIQHSTKGTFKLSRRGKQIRTAILLAVIITGANAFISNAEAANQPASTTFQYITVHSGETLWQIAEKYSPNTDPRDFIAEVVSLNQLKTSVVNPGQRIALPNN
ncbi:MAG: LysM peptidoglycan-binding domain-containing protein [Micrococcales bacterium]